MSRYDNLSTQQLETSLKAMGKIAEQYGETSWKTGQSQMHNEINQVLDELEARQADTR
ncbi:hypothetical protein [Streptomyces candidus]|uniref:Uncharacterized protein n=1 Tax=Streptomyces candidus TaxID=67283 RepID=A0A7X0HNV1_9ACTN|nr:hypothetical protein [Streptomyces candidus]MBB6439598.1 hypothetical protein [Streptomyces candidus]GHH54710.1 hypothetical protein GCM10018773_58120 [Streptomyces candidus]